MGRRFRDQSYRDAWTERGEFPRIHDAIFGATLIELDPGERALDLCCSTGLLGARLATKGYDVAFAERDQDAVERGTEAGTFAHGPLWNGSIDPESFPEFLEWMIENDVTQIVARRCLCEISKVMDLADFAAGVSGAGVSRIVLEGQRGGQSPISPGSAQAEGLKPVYKVATKHSPAIFAMEQA